ncbi:hypothetical protein CIB84_005722 [Bambusicola thoracicus]|uniref:glycerol kinase n=1 Tax=Bambusicola thoracicus TaxID=9083 RepID=A0A2P4T2F7_BAMTH|nr:hypothetical protein CIB84_005722 [Bambusicola thoracicus]
MPCGQPGSGAAPALYVVGVDVGSTTVKCHVYDRAAAVRGSSCRKADEAAKKNDCCFGTVDTWLLYRLTKGSVFATDYSNASSTGVFEPFTKCWNPTLCNLLSIPMSIYPPVKDTSFNFGSADSEIFGVPIPITALVADQQSAMFGECCFQPGDVKLTMGTGGFWDVNTGGNLFASHRDLFTNVDETAKMARSIVDSQGVCFVPGFQVSANDPYLSASFMGLKPTTTRNHLVRAILESVAFRNKQLFDIIVKKVRIPLQAVRTIKESTEKAVVFCVTAVCSGLYRDDPSALWSTRV